MYFPYLDCISANISHKSRMINQYRARHSYQKSLQGCIQYKLSMPYHLRHHPFPQGKSGTTLLYGGGHDVQHRHVAKKTKPPNPLPVGKAGLEAWVLTKGGLVSVHHRRLYRTVVHVHLLGRYANPSPWCVRV
jgi:hypothetical protein